MSSDFKPGLYLHYKGAYYTADRVVRNSTNGSHEGKEFVLYQSHEDGEYHIRERWQFEEAVDIGGGVNRACA